MRTLDFLADIKNRGIKIHLENGSDLRLKSKKGAVTPVIREEIKKRKPEIIALLRRLDETTKATYEGIPAGVPSNQFPLSFAQERLWFVDKMVEDSPVYLIGEGTLLEGPLDTTLLERSLQTVIGRHETLRTAFEDHQGRPKLKIHKNPAWQLGCLDLRRLEKDPDYNQVRTLALAFMRKTFDLAQAPLMRAMVYRIQEEQYLFLLNIHHIIADGWSMGILSREWMWSYNTLLQGKPHHLPYLPIQYSDFAHWQRQTQQGPAWEAKCRYWRDKLAGISELQFPTDFPRPPKQTYDGAIVKFPVDASIIRGLRALAAREQVSLYMVLLAAFQTLLHRYTNQTDISVGTAVGNRNQLETEGLIGLFVNLLVMRTDFAGDPSFQTLLSRAGKVAREAYEYADIPFEKVVEICNVQRDLSRHPLFQIQFLYFGDNQEKPPLEGLRTTPFPWGNEAVARQDISLDFIDKESGLLGQIEYNSGLFEASTMKRLARHMATLLQAILDDPTKRVSTLALLPPEESAVFAKFNQTEITYPGKKWIHELFQQRVSEKPEAPALFFEDEVWSYARLGQNVNAVARTILGFEMKPVVPVGLCMERSPELVTALMATLTAGKAYLPLDPAYPEDRLKYMLADSGVSLVVVDSSTASKIARLPCQTLLLDGRWDEPDGTAPSLNLPTLSAGHEAYMIYTSGSTGRPKLVVNTHGAILNRLQWMQATYPLFPTDRVLQKTPFTFDVSVWEFFWPLMEGASLVLARPQGHKDPTYLSRLISEKQVTALHFVPSMLRAFLETANLESNHRIKRVFSSGEALPPELVNLFHKKLNAELHNLYGPTEAAIDVTYYACVRRNEEARVPIGVPVANTQIHIVDGKMDPVPVGVPGELMIGGCQLARGYGGRPALTGERFVPNPFGKTPGERLYRSGDQARQRIHGPQTAPVVEFLGRLDNQIKLRGFRIELGEIEASIKLHPEVHEAAVVLTTSPGGEKYLVAYVVGPSTNHMLQNLSLGETAPSPDQLLRPFLKNKLPEYMIPAFFVSLEAFPLTASGKLDRVNLANRPLPEIDSSRESDANWEAPRTQTEEMLAAIWMDLLELERVDRNGHFFDLGGHSLLATQLVSRIHSTFAAELSLDGIFESPTLTALSRRIDLSRSSSPELDLIQPVSRDQPLLLSPAQRSLWTLTQVDEAAALAYNMPLALRMRGPLHLPALENAIQELVRRHETLRTHIQVVDDHPRQVIDPPGTCPLRILDLQPLEKAENSMERLAEAEAQTPFEMDRGPLYRVHLIRLQAQDHTLLFTLHHIISDGWSFGVVFRELELLYTSFVRGQPNPLPEIGVHYVDFAQHQRRRLNETVLAKQRQYWRRQLAGAPRLHQFPTDRPRPPKQRFHGKSRPFQIPVALTEQLRERSRQSEVTLFMTLQAGFLTLLFRYSGQADQVIGTPITNRNRQEIEGLVGFFVNTLALRTDLSDDPNFADLLARVRRTNLDAYAHQDLSFEQVVETLKPERDLSHSPLVQILFLFQNTPDRAPSLPGLVLGGLNWMTTISKFDLTLGLTEDEGNITGGINYNSDLFDATTIDRAIGHFCNLLEGLCAEPQKPLTQIEMINGEERDRILRAWNDTADPHLEKTPIPRLFSAVAARAPDRVALRFENQVMTYSRLQACTDQLAGHLRSVGAGPEVVLAVFMERSLDMVVGLLATLKSGAAYLPLDPELPRERLALMLEDAGVSTVLTLESLRHKLPSTSAKVVCIDHQSAIFATCHGEHSAMETSPAQLAYVIYTSGSTGRPKGVANSHAGISNRLAWMQDAYKVTSRDVLLQKTPFSFDVSVWEFFWPLTRGATLVISRPGGHRDSLYLGKLMTAERVTMVHFVPSMLGAFLDETHSGLSLKNVFCSGEALPAEMTRRFHRCLPEVALHNLYGPTEAAIDVTAWHCRAQDNPHTVPIGKPISNMRIYLLDSRLQPVPLGVSGDLYIAGVGLARGYQGRPKLTATAFIPDPFATRSPGERLYRTGDLASYRMERNDAVPAIRFMGRADHQVKLRGHRIELEEIETALTRHTAAVEAAVLLREARSGSQQIVAYVVHGAKQEAPDAQEIGEELRRALAKHLPGYMIPSIFVPMDKLPVTAHGKVDKGALPQPEQSETARNKRFVAPNSVTEVALATIWAEVLGLPRVGIHDNFFALGGDSILSLQVTARAARQGLKLKPNQIFEYQTIEQLIAAGGIQEVTALDQSPVTGSWPLTPIQWDFFEARHPEPHHFNQALLFTMEAVAPALLERALAHMTVHHDGLRSRFFQSSQNSIQVQVETNQPITLLYCDLSGLEPQFHSQALEAATAGLQRSLNYQTGPLIRAAWFSCGSGPPYLFMAIHHLVVDGVSWGILMEDLQRAHGQLVQGHPIQLPAKTTSFKQWANRLQNHGGSEEVDGERDYWLQLSRVDNRPLPADQNPLPGEREATEPAHFFISLEREPTLALLRDVPRSYRTQVTDLLLTALVEALSDWTGQDALLMDLEGHGREGLFEDVDLSRTLGWFTSLYPVLLTLPQTNDPGQKLKSVKEQLRAVPNRGIGFGVLRHLSRDQGTRNQMANLPRPQIVFNYLGQFDRLLSKAACFQIADRPIGPSFSPTTRRRHLIEVNARIEGDRLGMGWTYDPRRLQKTTLENLARQCMTHLASLINHCLTPGIGGVTPSDFPLIHLSQTSLDELLRKAAIESRQIEDLYPLSPTQLGMLFHSQFEQRDADHFSEVYINQLTYRIVGDLHLPALENAFSRVMERHGVLRTSFHWENLESPLQLVHRKTPLPLQILDWRGHSSDNREEQLQVFLQEDRKRGFSLGQPSLFRLAVIQLDDRCTQWVWTHHHIVLDGWSFANLLEEMVTLYEANLKHRDAVLKAPPAYGRFIHWLSCQDQTKAASFWRASLGDFDRPIHLPETRLPTTADTEIGHEDHVHLLSTELTKTLNSAAQSQNLTLNTLAQGAWALPAEPAIATRKKWYSAPPSPGDHPPCPVWNPWWAFSSTLCRYVWKSTKKKRPALG